MDSDYKESRFRGRKDAFKPVEDNKMVEVSFMKNGNLVKVGKSSASGGSIKVGQGKGPIKLKKTKAGNECDNVAKNSVLTRVYDKKSVNPRRFPGSSKQFRKASKPVFVVDDGDDDDGDDVPQNIMRKGKGKGRKPLGNVRKLAADRQVDGNLTEETKKLVGDILSEKLSSFVKEFGSVQRNQSVDSQSSAYDRLGPRRVIEVESTPGVSGYSSRKRPSSGYDDGDYPKRMRQSTSHRPTGQAVSKRRSNSTDGLEIRLRPEERRDLERHLSSKQTHVGHSHFPSRSDRGREERQVSDVLRSNMRATLDRRNEVSFYEAFDCQSSNHRKDVSFQ